MLEQETNFAVSSSYYIFITPVYFYKILPKDREDHKASFINKSICCGIFLIMLPYTAPEVSLYMCNKGLFLS